MGLHAVLGGMFFLIPGPEHSPRIANSREEVGANYLLSPVEAATFEAVLVAAPAEEPIFSSPVEPTIRVDAPPMPASGGRQAPVSAPSRTSKSTTFFNIEAQGRTFVYVIDRSSSMGPGGGLRAAREELVRSLAQLPPMARFQVIVYNRHAEPLLPSRPEWLEVTRENLEAVAVRLAELPAEGGTDHLPALRRAFSLCPDVIFFLTDADDLTVNLLREVARLNAGRHTVVHAIEMSLRNRDRPEMPMHVLSHGNGGTYRAVEIKE
jgi:hypothetical protein